MKRRQNMGDHLYAGGVLSKLCQLPFCPRWLIFPFPPYWLFHFSPPRSQASKLKKSGCGFVFGCFRPDCCCCSPLSFNLDTFGCISLFFSLVFSVEETTKLIKSVRNWQDELCPLQFTPILLHQWELELWGEEGCVPVEESSFKNSVTVHKYVFHLVCPVSRSK